MENEKNSLEDNFNDLDISFNKDEIKDSDSLFFVDDNKNNENLNKSGSNNTLDLNEKDDSLNSDKLDLCNKSIEEEMNKVTSTTENQAIPKKKLTKDDLKTIPIPIFECLFCADEFIAFSHLINENLSSKYLFNANKSDISIINFLIENDLYINDLNNLNCNNIDINKLKDLEKIIINCSEFLSKFYITNDSNEFFKKYKNYYKCKINENEENFGNFDDLKEKNYVNANNKLFDNDDNDENDDEDSFMDLRRKIKKSDIVFEDKPYDIWGNYINDDEIIELEKNENQ